jgi:hypothetical protein
MSVFRTIGIAATAVAVVTSIVPLALAGGEPKNQLPFTRPSAERTTAQINAVATATHGLIQGEPKNQIPFTAKTASQAAAIAVRTSSGFDWTAAAIGAAAVLGLMLAAAGTLVLARMPRARKATAAL